MSDKGKEGKMLYFISIKYNIVLSIIYIFSNQYFNILNLIILELIDFKARRVSTFNKNLLELAEWEIKHAQVYFFKFNSKNNLPVWFSNIFI